jgi:RecA-family ATPase
MQAAINGARKKWDIEDPTNTTETAEEEPGPFPASDLKGKAEEREWIVKDWIPKDATTSIYGDGGVGKSLIIQQLATAAASNNPWLGMPVMPLNVLYIAAEDDRQELHRRQDAIDSELGIPFRGTLKNLHLWPRVGHDNLLITFDLAGKPTQTPLVNRVVDECKKEQIGLLIIDTIADVFGGNENNRTQVNYFVKSVIGRIHNETKATIILLGHPSLTGMASGTGAAGSTAWNNAVRSRVYLSKTEEGTSTERTLTRKKSNYAASGDDTALNLYWENGAFRRLDTSVPTDTTHQILFHSTVKEILRLVKKEAEKGTPLKASTGAVPRTRTLSHVVTTHFKTNGPHGVKVENTMVMTALKYTQSRGHLVSKKLKGVRGFQLTEYGAAILSGSQGIENEQ